MKKIFLIRLMTACFLGLFLISCSNDDSDTATIPETSLKIIVKDSNGNPVPSANVRLFLTNDDINKETNQVFTTKTTNSSGEVTFPSVSPITYYFRVDKGCQNNLYSTAGVKLVVNMSNSISTVIGGTGKLSFSNTSSNSYDVYVNDVLIVSNMVGKTTDYGIFPTGTYAIKVVQKSGYIFTPTVLTYTGTLLCGGELTTTFP